MKMVINPLIFFCKSFYNKKREKNSDLDKSLHTEVELVV